eukprot:3818483-Prorocentrum_lima.AAC.1
MSAGRVTVHVVCGQVLRNDEELAATVLRTTGSAHFINLAISSIKSPAGLKPRGSCMSRVWKVCSTTASQAARHACLPSSV